MRQIRLQGLALAMPGQPKNRYPDLTILLDLTPEQGFERAVQRGMGKDRIEKEKIEFFKRVRNMYLERAKQHPDRIVVVDASKPLEEVQQDVATILDACLKKSKTAWDMSGKPSNGNNFGRLI